jgi:DNA-binding XRE family transcriptional regulator
MNEQQYDRWYNLFLALPLEDKRQLLNQAFKKMYYGLPTKVIPFTDAALLRNSYGYHTRAALLAVGYESVKSEDAYLQIHDMGPGHGESFMSMTAGLLNYEIESYATKIFELANWRKYIDPAKVGPADKPKSAVPEFISEWGSKVAEFRKQHNITQAQLAEATGIKQCNISRIECGKVAPTLTTIKRIEAALKPYIEK